MPRLRQIDPATDTGSGADLLNTRFKGKQINIYKGLANHPKLFEGFLAFGKSVKSGVLSGAEHETVGLVTAERNNCEYCIAAHTKVAEGFGINDEQALNIRRNQADNEKHQALIDFTNAILDTNGYVSDEQLEAFRSAGYDDKAVLEVIGEITTMIFTNLFNHVNETEIDFPIPAAV